MKISRKVYIVMYGYDYEGNDIAGVFSTKEKAEEFLPKIQYGDNKMIYEWEVDTFNDHVIKG